MTNYFPQMYRYFFLNLKH